jgi:predicted ribosomally synthesized peptide with nif11-like leader
MRINSGQEHIKINPIDRSLFPDFLEKSNDYRFLITLSWEELNMLSKISQQFNEHLAQSPQLQQQLRLVKSPVDLLKLAKQEGFELTKNDFQQLAQQAYQDWLRQLNPSVAIFFERVHSTPELNDKLHQCNSGEDLITLADECGFQLTPNDLKQAAQIAESIKGFSFEKLFFQNLRLLV